MSSSFPSVAISCPSSWPLCGIRRLPPRALVFILCSCLGGMRRPKNPYYIPLPLPSSFFLLFSFCLLVFCFFSLLFFFPPFSSPRAGCGALNTHLAPFVFFSLLLLPFLSFLLPPRGLRRPKYAWGPPFFSSCSLFLALSLSFFPSFLLPLFQLLPVVPLSPFRDGVFVVSFFNFAVLFFYQV